MVEALQHRGHELRLELCIVSRPGGREAFALHHHLRAHIGFWFQQHRVHMHGKRQVTGHGLKRLRPADFAAICGDRGIVGHVLRLERRDGHPTPTRGAAEARDQHGLADIGAGALDHDGFGHALFPAHFTLNTPRPSEP